MLFFISILRMDKISISAEGFQAGSFFFQSRVKNYMTSWGSFQT